MMLNRIARVLSLTRGNFMAPLILFQSGDGRE